MLSYVGSKDQVGPIDLLLHESRPSGSWLIFDVGQKMKCSCAALSDAFYVEDGPKGFVEGLVEKDPSSENWKRLYECPACTTRWVVDEWDKYGHQVASRVRDQRRWDEESEEERKSLLLESRGGLTGEKCAWLGCEKKKVRGVAYCIDHLYATGARK